MTADGCKKDCGRKRLSFFTIHLSLLICTVLLAGCEMFGYGQVGGADVTGYYLPNDPEPNREVFEERMTFLSGVWYSHYAGIGRLDGYRIRRWGDFNEADRKKTLEHFPDLAIDNLRFYMHTGPGDEWGLEGRPLQNDDYVVLYDDTAYGQTDEGAGGNEDWGYCYFGVVRAINIFNGDKNRGAIIIEYFEGGDPRWLFSSQTWSGQSQGLNAGDVPFFGIYYRALGTDVVQMANAVDLAALYEGKTITPKRRPFRKPLISTPWRTRRSLFPGAW